MTTDIHFFDKATQREMKLVMSGPLWGWLVYRHPDGQWVTLRQATFDDRQRLGVLG